MITFDLQQRLPAPSLNTIIELISLLLESDTLNSTTCCMWHEAISGGGSEKIASCLTKFISDLPNTITPVIGYFDSCPSQNKNVNVAAALSFCISTSQSRKLFDHKFLKPCDTWMECDTSCSHWKGQKNPHKNWNKDSSRLVSNGIYC